MPCCRNVSSVCVNIDTNCFSDKPLTHYHHSNLTAPAAVTDTLHDHATLVYTICMYVSFKLLSHLSVYMHLLASVDIDDCQRMFRLALCFHRHLYWKQSFSLCLCSLWIMRRNHHTRSRSRSRTPRNMFASCPQAQKTWLRFGWPWMMWMSRLCLKKPATCMRWKKMLRWAQWWAQSAPWTPTELAALSSKAKCLFLLQPHQLKKRKLYNGSFEFQIVKSHWSRELNSSLCLYRLQLLLSRFFLVGFNVLSSWVAEFTTRYHYVLCYRQRCFLTSEP